MRENYKSGGILTIFIIALIAVIVIGFFVPRNSFTPTETKKTKTFGQFSSRTSAKPTDTPAPLRWKKSFVYEKQSDSDTKSQSYMQYMMDKNKK